MFASREGRFATLQSLAVSFIITADYGSLPSLISIEGEHRASNHPADAASHVDGYSRRARHTLPGTSRLRTTRLAHATGARDHSISAGRRRRHGRAHLLHQAERGVGPAVRH